QLRQACAGTGSAWRPVEPAGVDDHGVARVAAVPTLGDQLHMLAAGNARIVAVHRAALRVDRVHDGQTDGQHPVLLVDVEGNPYRVDGQNRVEVAAISHVVADLAEARHVHYCVEL